MANCCTPEKFLCYFRLKTGATVVGILMCCLTVACTIAAIVQIVVMEKHPKWDSQPWVNAYAFTVVACIEGIAMILVNVWLLWGVKKEIPSVILGWVMLTALWLGQSLTLLVVLLLLSIKMISFIAWIICFVLVLIAIGIFIYGLVCVYAYWLELRNPRNENTNVN